MGRFAQGLKGAVGGAIVVVALAGCSAGHSSATPDTTAPAATLPVATGPSTTAPVNTAPTTVPTTTTTPTTSTTATSTPTGGSAHVVITGFVISPQSPVACNTPTMIELRWMSSGSKTVELSIDGHPFSSFPSGAQDHLEYFACDGKAHTYTLTAQSGGARATDSQTVTSTKSP